MRKATKAMEQLRQDVYQLLKKSTCHKLNIHGSAEALSLINEAEKLAFDRDGDALVFEPLPSLIRYRKALILFRRTEISSEALQDIDQHLSLIQDKKFLGPWPKLYRLAVLGRLKQLSLCKESTLQVAVKKAIEAVKNYIELINENDNLSPLPGVVQREIFNALELCVLFLGSDYSAIEGLGTRHFFAPTIDSDLLPFFDFRSDQWIILGKNVDHDLSYSKPLALAELEDRETSLRANKTLGFVFVLGDDDHQAHCLQTNNKLSFTERELFIISYYFRFRSETLSLEGFKERLAEKLELKQGAFRKTISVLKSKLENSFNIPPSNDLFEGLDGFLIVGAVNRSFLNTYPH